MKIKRCPFSTEIVLDRSRSWFQNVKTRFGVYPIHISGAFTLTPSLSSAFYLVLLRLFAREYDLAARLITTCSTDTAFNEEEKAFSLLCFHCLRSDCVLSDQWIMSMVKNTVDDSHPDGEYVCVCACVCVWCACVFNNSRLKP